MSAGHPFPVARACAHYKYACYTAGALILQSLGTYPSSLCMHRPAPPSVVPHLKMSGTNWRVCIVPPGFRCKLQREHRGHVFFILFPPRATGFKGIKGHVLLFFGCLSIMALQLYQYFPYCSHCWVKPRSAAF